MVGAYREKAVLILSSHLGNCEALNMVIIRRRWLSAYVNEVIDVRGIDVSLDV